MLWLQVRITLCFAWSWLLPRTVISLFLRRRRSTSCINPSFDGPWEKLADYPFSTIEAQGGFVGDHFVITGGFYPDSSTATVQTWAYSSPTNQWERRADYPLRDGLTHAAIAMDSTNAKLYVCGGYLGGNPGPATAKCFVYQSSLDTWTPLPDLPSPRGGGGLVYSQSMNALIFSSGAQRVQVGEQESMDFVDAWMLNLTIGSNTWIAVANSLLLANHISSVTGIDGSGMEHYYFLGGQAMENEETGNKDQMEEYLLATNTWTSRKTMDMKRGHSNAATIPYQCGILIAGGSINGTVPREESLFQIIWEFFKGIWNSFWGLFLTRSATNDEPSVAAVFKQSPTPTVRRATTADVSFYDIATDTWTVIGELNAKAKTVICDIKDNYLYCGTGGTDEFFRRKFSA